MNHLYIFVVTAFVKVITSTDAVPIVNHSSRSRVIFPGAANQSRNSFNQRRRDIFFGQENPLIIAALENDAHVNASMRFETNEIHRKQLLVPDLDTSGNPTCLSNPSDTFCESVQNYPRASLKHEVKFSPIEFLELFGTKEIDGRKSYNDEDSSEERVCRRIPKIIYPKMAKNQANQWIYVVNEVEYTQAVVAEICEKENKPCAYLEHSLPPGMYSKCRQRYAYKKLLALHPTEKRTYTDTFQFPSCCACFVKSSSLFGRSIGKDKFRNRNNNTN